VKQCPCFDAAELLSEAVPEMPGYR
jgi:hypothetical protein